MKRESISSIIPEFGFDSSQLQGTSFSCNFCDDKFTNRLKIAMHYVLNHELRYCSICTILFASDDDKDIHENQIHYPLKCANCIKEFNDNQTLKEHYTEEHSAKLCDYCPTLVQPIDQYTTHVTRRHAIQNINEVLERKPEEIFEIDRNKLTYLCFMCLKGKKLTEIFGHYVFYHNMSINAVLEYAIKYSDILKIDGATSKPINSLEPSPSSSTTILATNQMISDISNINVCGICKKEFTDQAPKLVHDIFCKGLLLCIECETIFTDPIKLKEHTNNDHKEIPCKFGCEVKLNLNDIKTHTQLIHDITACILCGLVTSSCSNKLNSHLKEKHNVDLQIYEKQCSSKSKLYRLEGKKSKKVLCNFCNNDITNSMDDLCNLIKHYATVHEVNNTAMIKILEKNPIQRKFADLKLSESKSTSSSTQIDYLKFFQHITNTDKSINELKSSIAKGLYEFDANLIHCIASDTSDDDEDDDNKEELNKSVQIKQQESTDDDTSNDDEPAQLVENQNKKKKFVGVCQFCGTKTMAIRTLFSHMQSIHGFELKNNEPRCSLCKTEFSTFGGLSRHNKRKHTPVTSSNKKGIYECPFCVIELTTKGGMRKHVKEHIEISTTPCTSETIGFKCRYCLDLFWSSEQRNYHQIENHASENANEIMFCYLCGSVFSSKVKIV